MARRGEIWMVSLDPVRGSEQAGTRPALILQNENSSSLLTPASRCRRDSSSASSRARRRLNCFAKARPAPSPASSTSIR